VTRPAPLLLTSLQAPHADPFCRRLTPYLADRMGRPMRFVDDEPWQARERRLDAGEIDVAWICGLPYCRRRDQPDPTVSLVAGPVMAQERYRDLPIYFCDVVVRRASPWTTFAELRGTRWAYNEPSSHSGYALTRFELARGRYGRDLGSEPRATLGGGAPRGRGGTRLGWREILTTMQHRRGIPPHDLQRRHGQLR